MSNDNNDEINNGVQLILDKSDKHDDIHANWSRKKEGLFHMFTNLPMGTRVLVKSVVLQLLIQATFIFWKEDYEEVANFLRETEDIDMTMTSTTITTLIESGGVKVCACTPIKQAAILMAFKQCKTMCKIITPVKNATIRNFMSISNCLKRKHQMDLFE